MINNNLNSKITDVCICASMGLIVTSFARYAYASKRTSKENEQEKNAESEACIIVFSAFAIFGLACWIDSHRSLDPSRVSMELPGPTPQPVPAPTPQKVPAPPILQPTSQEVVVEAAQFPEAAESGTSKTWQAALDFFLRRL